MIRDDGYQCWNTLLDEHPRFFRAIGTLKKFAQPLNCGVAVSRSDGGGEHRSLSLQLYFTKNGIDHEVNCYEIGMFIDLFWVKFVDLKSRLPGRSYISSLQ